MHRPKLLWLWPDLIDDFAELDPLLRSFANLDATLLTRSQLNDHLGTCQILVPRLEHEIDTAVLDAAPRLRSIGTPSTGTDHIAVAETVRRGIRGVSIKDDVAFLNTVQATAELAWLLILACNRKIQTCLQHVADGRWESQSVRGHELIGRTLGVIGYGRLGKMVSRFALAFRRQVVTSDPKPITDDGVRQVSQEQLLAEADIVTLHVHLEQPTQGMFGADQFAQMKPGAFLVNTSRGGLIDEDALLGALHSGHLAGAGLDVVRGEREVNRFQRPLFRYAAEHDNFIITPHIGGCTLESQRKAVMHFAGKLRGAWQDILGNRPPA